MPQRKLWLFIVLIVSLTACNNENSNKSASNSTVANNSIISDVSNASNNASNASNASNNKSNGSLPSTHEPGGNENTGRLDDSSYDDSTLAYFGSYDLSGEFSELIRSNPIDRDYEQEFEEFDNSGEFSTTGWMQLEGKYADIWDKEMNEIYKQLLNKLDAQQKELLIESQRGWLQNHLKETEFVESTFLSDTGHHIGSQGLVNLQIAFKNRIKERTIQLFEYDYMLEGNAEFLYKGK